MIQVGPYPSSAPGLTYTQEAWLFEHGLGVRYG